MNFIPEQSKNAADVPYEEQPKKLNYTPPPNCRRLGNKEIMQEGDIAINPDDGRIINIGDKWIAAIGLLVEKNIIFTHVYRPLLSPSIYEKALTIATNKLKNLADDCRYFSVQCEAQHTLDIIDKMLRESQ